MSDHEKSPAGFEPAGLFNELNQGLVVDLTEVSAIHCREIHVEGFFTRVKGTGEVNRVNRKILKVGGSDGVEALIRIASSTGTIAVRLTCATNDDLLVISCRLLSQAHGY